MEALLSSYIHGYHVYKDILDSYHWQGTYIKVGMCAAV